MGERRKRKSMWHMEDENRPHPGDHNSLPGKERLSINNKGRGHEFMEPKSGDRLGHPSRELNKESTYYQNMSPGFDGIEHRKYKPYPEDDRSNSHRYRRKDRSRSRSRSKNSRDRVRSGSPRQDHKNQSHKCSDQRSEPDKQFKICHDFFAGRCRKGSQCRLDHSRNTSHGHSFTDSYSKVTGSDLRDDVPSYNHGEEGQLWKKSRNAVACSEFVKGWCKWGDSCRFSHHLASNGTDNTNNLGDNSNSRCDSKSSLHMENEDASWRTQEFGDIVMIGSNDKENMANKQENNTMSHLFPPPIEVRNVSVQEQHTLLDHRVVENSIVTSFGSDVLDDFKNSSNPTYPFSFPRQNQSSENELIPGQLSVSNATDVWRNILSSGVVGLETQAGAQLDLHSHVLNHQLETQSSACLDLHSQVKNHQLEGDCLDLHSQVKNPQLETQSGDHLDLQPQVPNHQRAVQILKGLLESKVTFPIGFPQEPINAVENGPVTSEDGNYTEQYNQVQVKTSPIPTIDRGPDNPKVDVSENSKQKQEAQLADPEAGEGNKAVDEESKAVENQKSEENVASKDEKAMRLFKNSLIEFVKDILKPTWKEGKLSREVHKTIVKKVVDKVTGTVQPDHVPKTQDKVDQYLLLSKPRISKLVQAYVERSHKTNS